MEAPEAPQLVGEEEIGFVFEGRGLGEECVESKMIQENG